MRLEHGPLHLWLVWLLTAAFVATILMDGHVATVCTSGDLDLEPAGAVATAGLQQAQTSIENDCCYNLDLMVETLLQMVPHDARGWKTLSAFASVAAVAGPLNDSLLPAMTLGRPFDPSPGLHQALYSLRSVLLLI